MAMTLDGKVATATRAPATFGSREDRGRLVAFRAQADAILVGAHTAATDHYAMGIPNMVLRRERIKRGKPPHPLRCIVTGRGNLAENLEIFRHDYSPVIIFTTDQMPTAKRKRLEKKARVILVGKKEIRWRKLMNILHRDFGVKKLLCEGGPTINFALLKNHLLDEIYLTLCPKIFGGRNAPTLVEGEGFPLHLARRARLVSVEQVGEELFTHWRIRNELHHGSQTPRGSRGLHSFH